MALQELLALFQGSSEGSPDAILTRLTTKLEELVAALEAVELADDDKAAPAITRLKWRAAGLSTQPLEELEADGGKVLRNRLRNVRKNIQATLSKLATWETTVDSNDVQEARDALLLYRRELEIVGGALRAAARRGKLFRGAMLLTPALLGSAAIYYLRTDRGLRLEQIEVLTPSVAYAPAAKSGATLTPRAEYLTDFMTEFSKHYFGHSSQFEAIYYDRTEEPKDNKESKEGRAVPTRRTMQHKISLRNASQGNPAYLSSISAVVDVLEKADFPWSRLTVTTHVTAATDIPTSHRSLIVKSDGIGPAVDVKATLKTNSGLVLSQRDQPILHRESLLPFQYVILPTIPVDPEKGNLAMPLYFHLSEPPATPAPQYFEVKAPRPGVMGPKGCKPNGNAADYGFWEEVRTVTRLRQVTPTAYAEPYTLEVRYASLKAPQDTLRFAGTMDASEAFYTGHPQLRHIDPRCDQSDIDIDSVGDSERALMDKLAFFLAPEKELTHPRGTDLITARLGLDLQGAGVGRHIGATQALDSFLNPQGVLSINLTMNMPSNNRYAVRVLLNGRESVNYRFEGLVPDFLTFVEEGPTEAVARLRKLFDAEQRRSNSTFGR